AKCTTWLLHRLVSLRSIATVCTCDELIGGLVAPLDGITRLILFSSNGVVIMKIISSTKARSSNGVTLISLSVERLWRWEYRLTCERPIHASRDRRLCARTQMRARRGRWPFRR